MKDRDINPTQYQTMLNSKYFMPEGLFCFSYYSRVGSWNYEDLTCAEWALDVCEYFGADVSEENGLRFYQEANRWCESK